MGGGGGGGGLKASSAQEKCECGRAFPSLTSLLSVARSWSSIEEAVGALDATATQ